MAEPSPTLRRMHPHHYSSQLMDVNRPRGVDASARADLETLQLRAATILGQLSRPRVCTGCEEHRVRCIFDPGRDNCQRCQRKREICIVDEQKLRWGPNEHKLLCEIASNAELLDSLLNRITNSDLPASPRSTVATFADSVSVGSASSADDSLFYFDWANTPSRGPSPRFRPGSPSASSLSQSPNPTLASLASGGVRGVGTRSMCLSSSSSLIRMASERSSTPSESSRMASESTRSPDIIAFSPVESNMGSIPSRRPSPIALSHPIGSIGSIGSTGYSTDDSHHDWLSGNSSYDYLPQNYSTHSSPPEASACEMTITSSPASSRLEELRGMPGEETTTSWVPVDAQAEYLSSPESIQFIRPLPGSSVDDLASFDINAPVSPHNDQQSRPTLPSKPSYAEIDHDDYESMFNDSAEWTTESLGDMDYPASPLSLKVEEIVEERVGDRPGNNIQHMQVSQFGTNSIINSCMSTEEITAVLIGHGCVDLTGNLDVNSFSDFPISSGGFGDVYSGRLTDGTRVAIKAVRFHPDQSEGGKYLKRAAKELHAWSKCRHVNVLELLGLTDFRRRIGMVSLWMENGSVRVYLGRHPDADRYHLCYGITDGLSYLHGIKVVHGDLKGPNVLMSDDGTPKLTDFGNSVLHECSVQYTNSKNDLSISPRWTAPEILEGKTTYSYAADVFALGMTLLETITGNVPYHDLAQDLAVIMAVAIKRKLPERPDAHIPRNDEYGNALWSLLIKCWAYESKDRPSAAFVRDMMAQVTRKKALRGTSC